MTNERGHLGGILTASRLAREANVFPLTSVITYEDWVVNPVSLGNGASARVYRVRQGESCAALKVFDPAIFAGDEEAKERLDRQKGLIDINEPELARIFAVGSAQIDGIAAPSILMELCSGESLEKPQFRQDISLPQARKIVAATARAAKKLLDIGFAHRDIKPANIMFDTITQATKLLDTGVIRPLLDHNDVSGHAFVGTKRYSPQEFLFRKEAGDDPDSWKAITFYQLGATLYELVFKRRPFDQYKVEAQLIVAIANEDLDFTGINDLPLDVQNLLRFSLHRNWQTRLQLLDWDDFLEFETPKADPRVLTREAAEKLILESRQVSVQRSDALQAFLIRMVDAVREYLLEEKMVVSVEQLGLVATFSVGKSTKTVERLLELTILPAKDEAIILKNSILRQGHITSTLHLIASGDLDRCEPIIRSHFSIFI